MPWLFGASACLVASKAHAWGDEGHRAIGELAFRYLTPIARARVQEALNEPGYETLADAATWPDTFARKHPEYDAMKSFHYVNVPAAAAHYERGRDCPNGCVVTALSQFSALLAQPGLSLAERRQCIYWVAHLMGDLHQPLHVAHPDGKGGNATRVVFFEDEERRSAHWVWDVGLIEHRPAPPRAGALEATAPPSYVALADELARELTPAKLRAYRRTSSAEGIVDEVLRLGQQRAFLTNVDQVDEAYERSRWPIIKEQLQKSAVRLAALLERALGRTAS